jgi:protocatechuate 3,4-dioxygenase beta subunit
LLLLLSSRWNDVAEAQQPCIPGRTTPRDQAGPFYLPDSPSTEFVAPDSEWRDASRRLVVEGRVLSSAACRPLPGVTVELWYAGATLYQDDLYRGRVVTNCTGHYRFTQTFPALYPDRPILHDHLRLSRGGEELLVTQMYFEGTETGYVSTEGERELQVASVAHDDAGARYVEFDMYVAVEDTESAAASGDCSGGPDTNGGPTGIVTEQNGASEAVLMPLKTTAQLAAPLATLIAGLLL